MKTIKRTLAVLLTLLMLIGAVPVAFATSKTATEAINWVKSQEGKALDYDGQFGAQCVDLAMYYYKYLGVSPAGGNGKDYATNALPSGWKRTKGGTPQKGDLLVYNGTSSNQYGHVAIFESTKVIWHGRYNGVGKVQKTTTFAYNDLSNYWGCIHPNFASEIETVTVSFNGNGGTPSKTSAAFQIGQEYGDAFPTAVGKEGYSFDGWYTSASGGTRHIRSTLASSSVTKLYAHWIKNSANVLKVNHLYKIYNEKSKLPWQVNGSSSGSYVCQQEEKAVNGQLWRVTYADDNGYYKFESLQGLNALDMNANNKFGYRNHLQIYTPHGNDSQTFSLVYRAAMDGTSGLYTIHSKNSGRVVGTSLNAGAELTQWDYHGWAQRFYFVENPDRRVNFYDNLNDNYLPSPKEVYEQTGLTVPNNHYSSRDTSYVTVSINPTEDSLTIKQLKAGSTTPGAIAGDMKWLTTLNGSYAFDISELNDSTMTLHFKAKSSVAGAKMHFRWGYTTNWYPVSLTTAWAEYTIDLPRDKNSGNNLHPVIDKACTVEIKDIALYEKGSTGYIGDTDTFSVVGNYYKINDATSCFTPLPTRAKEGYSFSGWYTKRVGGEKAADGNDYYDVSPLLGGINLYAHWTKDEVHTHNYSETVKAPTCTEAGYTTYVCAICGNSYSDNYVNALGHDYQGTVTAPTCTNAGYTTYTCSRCNDNYTDNEVDAIGHQFVETYIPETCTSNGYVNYQCTRCSENYQTIISPLGHQDGDGNGYCDLCEKELRPHDDPTNPTQSTEPTTDPTTPSPNPQNICKWCGKTHEGFFQGIIGFFHKILAAILGAKY